MKIRGMLYLIQHREQLLKEFMQDLSDLMHANYAKANIEKEIYAGERVRENMQKLDEAKQIAAVRYNRIIAKVTAVFRLNLPYKED